MRSSLHGLSPSYKDLVMCLVLGLKAWDCGLTLNRRLQFQIYISPRFVNRYYIRRDASACAKRWLADG